MLNLVQNAKKAACADGRVVEECGNDKIADSAALVAYVLYTSCTMFSCFSTKLIEVPVLGGVVSQVYVPISVSLMLVAILLRAGRWSVTGILGIAFVTAVFFLSGVLSNSWDLFYFFLLLLAIRGMDYARLMRCLLWELLIALVGCWICTKLLGCREWWGILDGVFVSGRGTYHPNLYSAIIFYTVLCIAFLCDRKRNIIPLLLLIVASAAFTYFVQHSDTTFILIILFALFLIIERFCPKISSFICAPRFFAASLIVVTLVIVVFVLVSVALYSPNNELLVSLDNYLHARIRLPSTVFQEYGGYPLLGKELETWTGSVSAAQMRGIPMMMLDCAYSLYALRAGLAAVICLFCLFCRACYALSKTSPSLLLWASFFIMMAFMVMEFNPARLCLNCTLPLLAEGLRPRSDIGRRVDGVAASVITTALPYEKSTLRPVLRSCVPIIILLVILATNALTALFDGTDTSSLEELFPKQMKMQCISANEGDSAGINDNSDYAMSMTIGQGGMASLTYLGREIDNRMYKEWVKDGMTTYYTFTDTSSPDYDGEYYAVRIVQPSSFKRGDTPTQWAWVLLDRSGNYTWSYWFTLNDDGSAVVGSGGINYEEASSHAREQAEVIGTWSIENDSGGCIITVDVDSGAQYIIFCSL